MKLIFCLQINVKGFLKLVLSFKWCMARHPEITQNNKVTISLQYLKKKVNDAVEFLHVDKDEKLLQIDPMILARMVKHSQIFKKSQKRSRDGVLFFASRWATNLHYCCQWKWRDKFKVPKIRSWQYCDAKHSNTLQGSIHVTYAIYSESTFCTCLNVKELCWLVNENWCNIWSLSEIKILFKRYNESKNRIQNNSWPWCCL